MYTLTMLTFLLTCFSDGPTSINLNPPSPRYPLEGDTITFRCFAECNPVCTYTWRDPVGNVIDTANGQLSLEQIYRSQAADYTCEARGEDRTLTETLTVVVHYPPDVSISVSPDSVIEGDTVTVVCTADSNPSRNYFTWRNMTENSEGLDGSIHSSDTQSTLTIQNALCQQWSRIQCSPENGVKGSPRTKVAELDIKCKGFFQPLTVNSNETVKQSFQISLLIFQLCSITFPATQRKKGTSSN